MAKKENLIPDSEVTDLNLFDDEEIEEKDNEVEEKINRSYMVSKSNLSKLQELKIKNPAMTFSDIINEAITHYYKTI